MNIDEEYNNVQKQGAKAIYDRNKKMNKKWFGKLESISGPGSSNKATSEFRKHLPLIFRDYQIKSVSDCPCGDFHWMKRIDLNDINYTGYDVVEDLIESNRKNNPVLTFKLHDAINDLLPKTDLIISRDFLFHLSVKSILNVLDNYRKSGSTYLLTTTFDNVSENQDLKDEEKKVGWGWRPINLEIPPFNLSAPVYSIDETYVNQGRMQKLYKINS